MTCPSQNTRERWGKEPDECEEEELEEILVRHTAEMFPPRVLKPPAG